MYDERKQENESALDIVRKQVREVEERRVEEHIQVLTLKARHAEERAELERQAKLYAALAKAQGSVLAAEKNCKNAHFDTWYADLGSIWDACRSALSANGLAVSQMATVVGEGKKLELITMMFHADGGTLENHLTVPIERPGPQGVKSAMTYAKRMALAAMVGIAEGDDDDAEAAQGNHDEPPKSAFKERFGPKPAQPPPPAPNAAPRPEAAHPDAVTTVELRAFASAREKAGWTADQTREYVRLVVGEKEPNQLTRKELHAVTEALKMPFEEAKKKLESLKEDQAFSNIGASSLGSTPDDFAEALDRSTWSQGQVELFAKVALGHKPGGELSPFDREKIMRVLGMDFDKALLKYGKKA